MIEQVTNLWFDKLHVFFFLINADIIIQKLLFISLYIHSYRKGDKVKMTTTTTTTAKKPTDDVIKTRSPSYQ